MFKPYFGYCNCGCNQPGLVVVKKGLIKQCNENQKKAAKSRRAVKLVNKATDSVKTLIKKLDDVVSLYIRNLYAVDGMVKCFTCPAIKPIKEMQCGHYISRNFNSLRWETINLRPQCYQCNVEKKGNYTVFADKLERETPGIIEKLEIRKHNKFNCGVFELKLLIAKFTLDLNKLKCEKR